jgi:hypothetical protein
MGGLFGGGNDSEVSYQPTETIEEKKKAKTGRSALIATQGGIQGEEIMAGGTKKRSTLLGN